jgi:hypothetical protein
MFHLEIVCEANSSAVEANPVWSLRGSRVPHALPGEISGRH